MPARTTAPAHPWAAAGLRTARLAQNNHIRTQDPATEGKSAGTSFVRVLGVGADLHPTPCGWLAAAPSAPRTSRSRYLSEPRHARMQEAAARSLAAVAQRRAAGDVSRASPRVGTYIARYERMHLDALQCTEARSRRAPLQQLRQGSRRAKSRLRSGPVCEAQEGTLWQNWSKTLKLSRCDKGLSCTR